MFATYMLSAQCIVGR